MHWNQTQHSQNSIWIVNTKEICQQTTVTHLQTTENIIGDAGTESLSEALKSNTTLKKLNLSCKHKNEPIYKNEMHIPIFLFLQNHQAIGLETEEQQQ